jgi:DNA invertase Pin-like site-specific DNA recombinase
MWITSTPSPDLMECKIGVRVRTGQGVTIDTTTRGWLVFSIFAALVEFERELVEEQVSVR